MSSFSDFSLPEPISKALQSLSFDTPTPIQEKALPLGLAGNDVIGIAETGSGKTAAFCIPILTKLLSDPAHTALILVPTRELAYQIDEFWRKLTAHAPNNRSLVVIGGVSMGPQLRGFNARPKVIIATPGRLIDHIEQRSVDLSKIGTLVLDEADRMLDMGFAPQLERIERMLPKSRQTLFFSATWEDQVDRLAKKYLRDPKRITVGERSRAAKTITQEFLEVTSHNKNERLLSEIEHRQGSCLVFTRTKSRCDRVHKFLTRAGVKVGHIHGGRSQAQRTNALENFKRGVIQVLVATDIAARGIDVSEIQNVFNYDLPMAAEDYVHRIGRTGRAGATGTAVSFITGEDRPLWLAIEKLMKRTGSPLATKGVSAPVSPRAAAASAPLPKRPKGGPDVQPPAPRPRTEGEAAFEERPRPAIKRSRPAPGPNAKRPEGARNYQARFADLRNKEARVARPDGPFEPRASFDSRGPRPSQARGERREPTRR